MRKSRSTTLGVGLLVGALFLSACGGDAGAPGEDASPAGNASGEIRFSSALAGMDKVAEAFNESQDSITVTFEEAANTANGGNALLTTAIEAGNAPDVAMVEYASLPQFVTSGNVIPLDEVLPAEMVDGIEPSIKDLVTLGDQTWAAPYDTPPMVAWYRADMLEAAGVEVPTSWEEFEAAGLAVQEKFPGVALASFNPNEAPMLAGQAWANGAQWFAAEEDTWKVGVTDAASLEVADRYQGLIDQGILKVVNAFSDEWTADITNSKVAGLFGGSWSATGIRARAEGQEGNWVAAQLPSEGGSLLGGSSFVIPKSSKNAAAAAKFIEYAATNPAAVGARGDTGSAYFADPDLTAAAKEAYDATFFGNDIYEVFDAAAATINSGWQWGPNYEITNTALKDAFSKVAPDGPSVADAFETAQAATVEGLEQSGLSVTE
ncbi:multiple sugar transport system substrate-binding protein [Arthrobacter pigmenti]|uniref:Multiple sugar transport system substrate-binding protein n=1 Tax=Arthrobacter pigmenti TaxID=271432 RepID=A0A846REQ0_9MICC|nr:extracellular solute-binding protein [Arthrobacter pigmenti]NJC21618.1 multiple sugar transport system substrate-binding protein [Arthrobacter pigmenti]